MSFLVDLFVVVKFFGFDLTEGFADLIPDFMAVFQGVVFGVQLVGLVVEVVAMVLKLLIEELVVLEAQGDMVKIVRGGIWLAGMITRELQELAQRLDDLVLVETVIVVRLARKQFLVYLSGV